MATVFVLIPCYNYGRFLGQCVESVVSQTGCDIRVLIIDDASPDGSGEVAMQLAATHANVEAVVHSKNCGHIATYNEGIARACGDYFLLLSADDYLTAGALGRAVALLEQQPQASFLYGKAHELYPQDEAPSFEAVQKADSRVMPGESFIDRVVETMQAPVPTPTAVVRMGMQQRAGGYRPSLPHSGDLEMWLRLASYGPVIYTDAFQGVVRIHGQNMSTSYYKDMCRDIRQRVAALDTFIDESKPGTGYEKLREKGVRVLAKQAYWYAVALALRGEFKRALELFRLVGSLKPANLLIPPIDYLFDKQRPGFSLLGRHGGLHHQLRRRIVQSV